jgi:hypothetical protein
VVLCRLEDTILLALKLQQRGAAFPQRRLSYQQAVPLLSAVCYIRHNKQV